MSQSHQFIEQLGDQETSINPTSSLKSATQQCLRSNVLSELDVFSASVTLNIDGEEVSRTKFGGCVNIIVSAFCIALTIITFFSDGISLKSSINVNLIKADDGDNGQSIFDLADEGIGYSYFSFTENKIIDIYNNFTIFLYQVRTYKNGTNTSRLLKTSTNCQHSQVCVKKQDNQDVAIYGQYFSDSTSQIYTFDPNYNHKQSSKIYVQFFSCDSAKSGCNGTYYTTSYAIRWAFPKKQILKNNQQKITWVYQNFPLGLGNIGAGGEYRSNFTKQSFSYNNNIFGHLSNLFSKEVKSYQYSQNLAGGASNRPNFKLLTKNASTIPTTAQFQTTYFMSSGQILQYTQEFDDIASPLLFFLSVKQTFYFLAVILFVKIYNQNANLLKISNSLFTMQDHVSYQKYQFSDYSPSVMLACFFYNHPLSKFIDKCLSCCGKNFLQIVPRKTFYTMMMMKKAQQLLTEHSFFGGLEQLSSLEDQPPKKIIIVDQYEEKNAQHKQTIEEKQEEPLNYFPNSEIKRKAFEEFCQINNFFSVQRKNHFYKILVSKNLQLSLPQQVKKQFSSYVQNIKIKVKQGKLDLKSDEGDDIPVQFASQDMESMYKKQPLMSHQQDSNSNIKIMRKQEQMDDMSIQKKSQRSNKSKALQMDPINLKEQEEVEYNTKHKNMNQESKVQNEHIELQSFEDDQDL